MKKLLLLLILILVCYIGYSFFVTGFGVFDKYFKKPEVKKEAVKPPAPKETVKPAVPRNHLILELELNNTVLVQSKNIPAGKVRLVNVSKGFCTIEVFNKQSFLTKKLDIRHVIDKTASIEVHLIAIKEKSVLISMTNAASPEDQMSIVR